MISDRKATFLHSHIGWVFGRYPVAVLAAATATLWAIGTMFDRRGIVELPFDNERVFATLAFIFFGATAAGLATTRYEASLRWIGQGVAFLLGVASWLWLRPDADTVTPLLVAFICAISLSAGIAVQKGAAGFWLANARLGATLAAVIVAVGLANLGGFIVLSAIDTLFGIRSERNGEILTASTWLFALPVLWLAFTRFDDFDIAAARDNILLRTLAVATDVLLIPLMLIFCVVIHLYAGRIAILGDLPKGEIGWIASSYLVVGYGIFLLAKGPEIQLSRLRNLFRRTWFASTLVPLALLALAVTGRVRAYGVTEERYWLVLLIVGALILVISVVIRRPLDIRFVPAVAGALALVAAIGPLSGVNLTIRSQTERARTILASVPADRCATVSDGGLSQPQKEALISAVEFLQGRTSGDLETLSSVWPIDLPKQTRNLKRILAVNNSPMPDITFTRGDVTRLDTLTLLDVTYADVERGFSIFENGFVVFTMRSDGHFLDVLGGGDARTRFDLSTLLATTTEGVQGETPILKSVEGRKGDLIPWQLERVQGPDGARLRQISARIVLY